ncbi:sodium-dependent transporter [Agathobaculum sp. NSJ-28]|uniref:Sodium-dependent transporter n=2 Tax=Agathobaculum TaxID=2048137 RepID=A0A923LT53_9FIRM|nr:MULTISPECIES: sodium-dependent transporter [Agathobaculum]MBC5723902.1 sodium-dependent transporter [Agathobaculum faecis]MBS6882775.1 sodium-dependent transporter [Clostridiaceae bacterium]MCU6787523.1 sodium-dependent transporter [Agathobaculum ammoniilyticum]SCI37761.1 Na+-dependent transporters of the SNF family [uncultured Butyricicoccus sp.]
MQRERLGSRLGFILLSAGCAIGVGNVWKFPWMVGQYGGGAFVVFYVLFLIILGLPIMTMEFAVGRASQKSPVRAYQALEKPGQKWHIHGYLAMIGNYLLMMFYTTVCGWMLHYFYLTASGRFEGATTEQVQAVFPEMLGQPLVMGGWMVVVVVVGFAINSFGLQSGLERVTKVMMLALLAIMVILAVNSILTEGAGEGLKFYLIPDLNRMQEAGIVNVIVGAMNQSFFTLSLGIGAMAIFGSYVGKSRALLGEAVNVAILDTFVAFTAGLIIFPACFAFGVSPDSGPNLIFVTLPNIFNHMAMGRLWGSLFFVFMAFAAFSTVLAVFENIISCGMDLTGAGRKKVAGVNIILIILLSLPCVLGYNIWSGFQPFGEGTAVLDLEDFLVSNIWLPLGSIIYLLFCTSRYGWGWKNFKEEANEGGGFKVRDGIRVYVSYILPLIVLVIFVLGIKDKILLLFS